MRMINKSEERGNLFDIDLISCTIMDDFLTFASLEGSNIALIFIKRSLI
jgi:hypothetical protein